MPSLAKWVPNDIPFWFESDSEAMTTALAVASEDLVCAAAKLVTNTSSPPMMRVMRDIKRNLSFVGIETGPTDLPLLQQPLDHRARRNVQHPSHGEERLVDVLL